MKRCVKRALVLLLAGMWCVCGMLPCAASAQERLLLDTDLIVEGREYVTVHEDGSWTVTGDVSFAFPVEYDYRMEGYSLTVEAETDGAFELEVDLAVSEEAVYPVLLGEEVFGAPFDAGCDESLFIDFKPIYQYKQLTGQWEATNRVRCTRLTYRAETATQTVFKKLSYDRTFCKLKGDVNNDGQTNSTDVRDLLFAVLERSGAVWSDVDIDDDGALTTSDARALLKIIVM